MTTTRALRLPRLLLAAAALAATAANGFYVPPNYSSMTVEEWTHDGTGRFRLVGDDGEKQAYASGAVEAGWRRTGRDFSIATQFSGTWSSIPERRTTCRFYNASAGTHLHTINPVECKELATPGTGWTPEGFDFPVHPPTSSGNCSFSGLETTPYYRLYNDRRPRGIANHRFTNDAALRAKLVREGWIDEGFAFCVASAYRAADTAAFAMAPDRLDAPCSGDGCIAMRNVRAPTQVFEIPPIPMMAMAADTASRLIAWPFSNARVYATHPTLADRADSIFAQTLSPSIYEASYSLGMNLVPADRLDNGLASMALRREVGATASAPMAPPWTGGRDSQLLFLMRVAVGRVSQDDPSGHAYGFGAIELRDQASGRALYVTLQAFGTQAQGDFALFDAGRDRAIVSTPFLPDRFGWGGYRRCLPGTCERSTGLLHLRHSIEREAFAAMLERARSADPLLSPDPSDYVIEAFECRGEIAGPARLGATFESCRLQVSL